MLTPRRPEQVTAKLVPSQVPRNIELHLVSILADPIGAKLASINAVMPNFEPTCNCQYGGAAKFRTLSSIPFPARLF